RPAFTSSSAGSRATFRFGPTGRAKRCWRTRTSTGCATPCWGGSATSSSTTGCSPAFAASTASFEIKRAEKVYIGRGSPGDGNMNATRLWPLAALLLLAGPARAGSLEDAVGEIVKEVKARLAGKGQKVTLGTFAGS